jgi:hypothetical protein
MADALYLDLRRPSEDDAEKWVGRARGVREQDATRQLELRAALEAERRGSALCIQALARFEERSSAAPVAAEDLAVPPESKPQQAQTRKSKAVRTVWEHVRLKAA